MDQLPEPAFGPIGRDVFERTYSRTKPDGSKESWRECVKRTVLGNMALVHGDDMTKWSDETLVELYQLTGLMYEMAIIPAGRHLWSPYTPGQTMLGNCHAPHWTERLSDHVSFAMLRLLEGGGTGSDYSRAAHPVYPAPAQRLDLHIVCRDDHPDYQAMLEAGVLSRKYSSEWTGAYEVGDSREGWAAVVTDFLDDYYRAGIKHRNRIYDISQVRPAGARLKRFGGTASGPLPLAQLLHTVEGVMNNRAHWRTNVTAMDLLEIDHGVAAAVVAGGVRRSARMSLMRWDDPEIDAFLDMKKDVTKHWSTNLSVLIDDAFIKSLDDPYSSASKIYALVVEGMLATGEPGLINLEKCQEGEVDPVVTVNPCGEATLEAWGQCLLGSINMEAFVPQGGNVIDAAKALVVAHKLLVRFLIRATFGDYADEKQRAAQHRSRRVGVGHMGVAGYLAKVGMAYSEASDSEGFATLLRGLYKVVKQEAADYCFELRIPQCIKISAQAPTGSISQLPGVTPGIMPIFGRYYERRVRYSKTNEDQVAQVDKLRTQGYHVEDCLYAADTCVVTYPCKDRLLEQIEQMGGDVNRVESVDELSVDAQLSMASTYQRYFCDQAVSFTVNVDPAKVTVRELSQAIRRWLPDLKGCAVFPEVSRPQAPYIRISQADYEAAMAKDVGLSNDPDCTTGCPIR